MAGVTRLVEAVLMFHRSLHSAMQSLTAASALTALPKATVLILGSKRVALANILQDSTTPKHCLRLVKLFVRSIAVVDISLCAFSLNFYETAFRQCLWFLKLWPPSLQRTQLRHYWRLNGLEDTEMASNCPLFKSVMLVFKEVKAAPTDWSIKKCAVFHLVSTSWISFIWPAHLLLNCRQFLSGISVWVRERENMSMCMSVIQDEGLRDVSHIFLN